MIQCKLMSIRKIILLGGLLYISFVGIGLGYVSHDQRFEIIPPDKWEVEEAPYGENAVSFTAPVEEGEFRVNIRIEWRDARNVSQISDRHRQEMKDAIRTGFKNGRILSEGETNVSGVTAYEMLAQITRGVLDLKVDIVVFIAKGMVYSIAFTTTIEQYDKFLPEFEESLGTFKVLDGIE